MDASTRFKSHHHSKTTDKSSIDQASYKMVYNFDRNKDEEKTKNYSQQATNTHIITSIERHLQLDHVIFPYNLLQVFYTNFNDTYLVETCQSLQIKRVNILAYVYNKSDG